MEQEPFTDAQANADLVGLDVSHFVRRVDDVRRGIRDKVAQATKANRVLPEDELSDNARFIVAPWGWVDFCVQLVDDDGPILAAIGVIRPGERGIGDAAASHDLYPVALRTAVAGGGGAIVGMVGSGAADWPTWAGGIATAAAAAIGAGSVLTYHRYLHKRRALSARLALDEPDFAVALHIADALMATARALREYPKAMKKAAKKAGLQPVPLADEDAAAPALVHGALWELLSGISKDSPAEVLAAAQALAAEVDADIASNWATLDSFRPPPLPAPEFRTVAPAELPPVPNATVADLQSMAEVVRTNRATREEAVDAVRRINRRSSGK